MVRSTFPTSWTTWNNWLKKIPLIRKAKSEIDRLQILALFYWLTRISHLFKIMFSKLLGIWVTTKIIRIRPIKWWPSTTRMVNRSKMHLYYRGSVIFISRRGQRGLNTTTMRSCFISCEQIIKSDMDIQIELKINSNQRRKFILNLIELSNLKFLAYRSKECLP